MTSPNSAITVRIVGLTDVGLIREHNEDNFLVIDLDSGESDFGQGRDIIVGPRGSLMVVCDGMGGAAAGEVASGMAVEVIRREMLPSADASPKAAAPEAPSSKPTIPPEEKATKPVEATPAPAAAAPSPEAQPAAATPEGKPADPAQAPAAAEAKAAGPESPAQAAPSDVTAEESGKQLDELLERLSLRGGGPEKAADPVSSQTPTAPREAAAAPAAAPAPAESAPAAAAPAEAAAPAPAPAAAEITVPPTSSPSLTDGELHALSRKLRIAATKANQEIYEAACADIAKAGMGTTLTGMLLVRTHVIVAQVGDSRAYMWRKGKLTQITHDQSLVNQLLDSGQITPEQAKLFEHSNVILQALGVQEDVEVVLSTEVVRRDDRLLLCSDGLVGVVADEEIQEVLTTSERIEDAARRLIDLARAGGGPDNITVIVAQVTGEDAPAPAAEEEVLYRPLYIDGDKPPERRAWPIDYGYMGQQAGGRDLPAGGGQQAQVSSRLSVVAMSAVLALLLAGIVGGVMYHKQPPKTATTGPASALPTPPTRPSLPPPLPPVPPVTAPAALPDAAVAAAVVDAGAAAAPINPAVPVPAVAVQPPVAPEPPTVAEQPEKPGVETPPEPGTAKKGHRRHKKPGDRPGGETPVATPVEPGTATPPEKPVTPPEKPATPPEQPAATPEKPAATPEKPAATPEKPVVTPEKPAAAPEKPAPAPEKPAPAAEKPAPAPEKPAAAPEKPAAAPEKPAAAPEAPKP